MGGNGTEVLGKMRMRDWTGKEWEWNVTGMILWECKGMRTITTSLLLNLFWRSLSAV